MKQSITEPFQVIAGAELGTQMSSYASLGELHPSRSLGQAKHQIFLNAATGNCVVNDFHQPVQFLGFALNLGMTYNSQASVVSQAWRLSLGKQLVAHGTPNQTGSTVVITNEDGSTVTFTFDETQKKYVAQGLPGGNQILEYNVTHKQWTWTQPGAGLTEQYNADGLQFNRTDSAGRQLTYHYDDQNRLQGVVGPAGEQLHFIWGQQTLSIYLQEDPDNQSTKSLLQTYIFDNQGRLQQTQVPVDSSTTYTTQFTYDDTFGLLHTVQQSDGTQYALTYSKAPTDDKPKCTHFIDGEGRDYQLSYTDAQHSKLITPLGESVAYDYEFTDHKQLRSVAAPVDTSHSELTQYEYEDNGAVKAIIHPDSSTQHWAYDSNGLVELTTDEFGHHVASYHDPDSGVLFSRTQTITLPDKQQQVHTTWFVHNDKRQLTFEVNSLGQVTHHTYDDKGNRISTRVQLMSAYDVSKQSVKAPISETDVLTWWSKQSLSHTSLTEFVPNTRGQVYEQRDYADVDSDGNGVANAAMGHVVTDWNIHGHWLSRSVAMNGDSTHVTQQHFDGLQRLTFHEDGEGNKTTHTYTKLQQQSTLPNGLVQTHKLDASGLTQQIIEEDPSTTTPARVTVLHRDVAGRVYQKQRYDGQFTLQYHDAQNRLIYEVSQMGDVTHYCYDERQHVKATIAYANTVDYKDIGDDFSISKLQSLIKPSPSKDRQTTYLYDWAGRLRYTIDGDRAVKEHIYAENNAKIATVKYATKLEDSVPLELTDGYLLKGIVTDPEHDRVTRYFYNDAGVLIGKQVASHDSSQVVGVVTEYVLDSAGRIWKEIVYATETPMAWSLDVARPKSNPDKDAVTYYLRDARGQVTATCDPEQYQTSRKYYANGLKLSQLRYANQLTLPETVTLENLASIFKAVTNDEDQLLYFEYDGCDRETLKIETPQGSDPDILKKPLGRNTSHHYNCMGKLDEKHVWDAQDPTSSKSERWQYNEFSQQTLYVDPRAAAQADNNMFEVDSLGTHHVIDPATGLVTASIDSLGHRTVYYYNANRELTLTIAPNGVVTRHLHNAFNQVTVSCVYANKLDAKAITTYAGGFITNDIVQQIVSKVSDIEKDQITIHYYDQVGLTTKTVDADNFQHCWQFNAFRQKTHYACQVSQSATAPVQWHDEQYGYDLRGNVTDEIIDPDGLALHTQYGYGFLNQRDVVVLPSGAQHSSDHDRLGREVSQTDALGKTSRKSWDAFNRVTSTTNRNGEETRHTYDSAKRRHTITSPAGRQLIEVDDVFEREIESTDSNGATYHYGYEPGDEKTLTVDPLGHETKDNFNVLGWHSTHTTPMGDDTKYAHDDAGHVTGQTEDPAGLAVAVSLELNSKGEEISRTNPIGVVSDSERDHRGYVRQQTVKNSAGHDYVITTDVNGLGHKTAEWTGDEHDAKQYGVAYLHDTAGRSVGKVIAPDTLKITSTTILNKNNKVIVQIDPKQLKTFLIRDALDRIVYKVMPNGAVVHYDYDSESNVLCQIAFHTTIDTTTLTQHTTVDDMNTIMHGKSSANDTVVYKRYDPDNKCVFQVTGTGVVTQYFYDLAGRRIGQTQYANRLDLAKLDMTNPNPNVIQKAIVPNPKQDRTHFHILNLAGQEVYSINPRGGVIEYQYDANGNKIATINYAKQIDISKIAGPDQYKPEFIESLCDHSDPDNRTTYQVRDALGRVIYEIDESLHVTFNVYDKASLIKTHVSYFNPLTALPEKLTIQSVAQAVAKIADSEKDATTSYEYDVKRNKVAITDAEGQVTRYRYNCSSQVIVETDPSGLDWQTTYDAAGRKAYSFTPETTVTIVSPDPKNPDQLVSQSIRALLFRRYERDDNGNEILVAQGYETPDKKRTDVSVMQFQYSDLNRCKQQQQNGVRVDNPTIVVTKPGQRSDTEQDVIRKSVQDAFGRDIVTISASGYPTFKVYDSDGKECYLIDAKGVVTEFTRDAFGQAVAITQYKNPLPASLLSAHLQDGLTAELVTQHLQPCDDDRTIKHTFDLCGNHVLATGDEIEALRMLPKNQVEYGLAKPMKLTRFNTFNEEILSVTLVDLSGKEWAFDRIWRNKKGWVVASADANGYVKTYRYQPDGKKVNQYEYKYQFTPSQLNISYADLKSLLAKHVDPDNDIERTWDYDRVGRQTEHVLVNAPYQETSQDSQGIPAVTDKYGDASTKTRYEDEGKTVITTHASGAETVVKHDECGRVGVRQKPARDIEGQAVIEQHAIEYDALNKEAVLTRSAVPVASASTSSAPLPELPADQVTLQWYQSGKLLQRQSPKNASEPYAPNDYFTFNLDGLPARKFQWVTGWNIDADALQVPMPLDSVRRLRMHQSDYDPVGHLAQEHWRDIQTGEWHDWFYFHNSFGEVIAEGMDGSKPAAEQPVQRKFNKAGLCWFTNESGGRGTIRLYDIRRKPAAEFTSAKIDLSQLSQSQLSTDVVHADYQQVARTGWVRDLRGDAVMTYFPQSRQIVGPLPLQITMQVRLNYPTKDKWSLVWPAGSEIDSTYIAKVTLDNGSGQFKTEVLKQQKIDDVYYFVMDITDYPADVYRYDVEYFAQDPKTKTPNIIPAFQAKGTGLVLDTPNTTDSLHLALKRDGDSELVITGKTYIDVDKAHTPLVGVALFQDDKLIAKVGVTTTDVPGRYRIDLSSEVSGTYTIKPIYAAKTVSDSTAFTVTNTSLTLGTKSNPPFPTRYNLAWSHLPPGCDTLQYRTYSKKRVSDARFEFSGDTVKTIPASSHSPELIVDGELVGVEVYALDSDKRAWYLGSPHNTHLPYDNAIPPYLYVSDAVAIDAVRVLNKENQVIAVLGLTKWMGGYQRADVSGITDISDCHFEGVVLGDPVDPPQPLPEMTITTRQKTDALTVREFTTNNLELSTFPVFLKPNDLLVAVEWNLPADWRDLPIQLTYLDDVNQDVGESNNILGSNYSLNSNYLVKGLYNVADTGTMIMQIYLNDQWVPILSAKPYKKESPNRSGRSGDVYYRGKSLLISPLPEHTASVEFEVLINTGDPRIDGWKSLTSGDLVGNVYSISINGFVPGGYQYRIKAYDADKQPIDLHDIATVDPQGWAVGRFVVSEDNNSQVTVTNQDAYTLVTPMQLQSHDHWHNIVSQTAVINDESEAASSTFKHEYNKFQQKTRETAPPALAVDEHGTYDPEHAQVTCWGFDLMRRPVSQTTDRGGVEIKIYNTANDMLRTVRADGVWQKFTPDAFGRQVMISDARGVILTRVFGGRNVVLAQTDANGWTTVFIYNERKQQIVLINPNKEASYYDYDERDRSVVTVLPEGQVHRLAYHFRTNELIFRDDGVRNNEIIGPEIWSRDEFGLIQTHTDLSGAITDHSSRDFMQNVTAITTKKSGNHGLQYPWLDSTAPKIPVPDQNLQFIYDEAGRTIYVFDAAQNQETWYILGVSGVKIGERYRAQDGQFYQDIRFTYDAQMRLIKAEDPRVLVDYLYDHNSNRRATLPTIKQYDESLDAENVTQVALTAAQSWNTYNSADVLTLQDGMLDSKTDTIVLAPTHGRSYTFHDNGWVYKSETHTSTGKLLSITYSYFDNGLLSTRAQSDLTGITYQYDPASRRTVYEYFKLDGLKITHWRIVSTYNSNSWLIEQIRSQSPENGVWSPLSQTTLGHFLNNGQPQKHDYYEPTDRDPLLHDDLAITYVGFAEPKIVRDFGTRTTKHDKHSSHADVEVTYDANGGYQTVTGATQDGFRWFANNAQGQVVFKETDKGREYYAYSPTGNGVLFWVGDLSSDPTDRLVPTKYNFTPELRDMNASWPPSTPLTHVVSAGDTFASIAEDLFGDASYAFAVAASIGYSTHQKPPLGRVIRVMPTANMALHDHAGQFAPYASSRILGSLYPKIPMPPVNDDDSFFGMFLEFLVGSLLMTIAPWLTFELDDVLGAFMARVVGFAVGSSIADVGQQLVGMATGMQHGFHFKELEESFESGAIQGVLGKLLHIDPFDLQTAGSRGAIPFPRSLLYHELVNVATQSVELAAGQKRRWDWAGLTTALVQATGGEVSNLFGGHSKGNLMAITFNTLAGNGARSLIDHTPFNPEAIFAQITGTFIGQEVGGKLFPNPEEQQRKKEEQYFNYQDYLRSQREHSPWNEVDDLADDISGSNPYGDNVADRWSYDFSKGGSTVDPHQNSTRPSSDWQHVGFAVFGHAPKSDPETAPEPTHVAKQNAHHQAVQVKSQITVAHQQDRHESSAVRASGVGSDVRSVEQKVLGETHHFWMTVVHHFGRLEVTPNEVLYHQSPHDYVESAHLLGEGVNGLNWLTYNLMLDVAGGYGADYYQSLHQSVSLTTRVESGVNALSATSLFSLAGELSGELIDPILGHIMGASQFAIKGVFGRFFSKNEAPIFMHGSGPASGVIGVYQDILSAKSLANYFPSKPMEYVYDPQRKIFLVGRLNNPRALDISGSGHEQLAKILGSDSGAILGGIFSRGEDGEIRLNEYSGHYGENWLLNSGARSQLVELISNLTGQSVVFEAWSGETIFSEIPKIPAISQ